MFMCYSQRMSARARRPAYDPEPSRQSRPESAEYYAKGLALSLRTYIDLVH